MEGVFGSGQGQKYRKCPAGKIGKEKNGENLDFPGFERCFFPNFWPGRGISGVFFILLWAGGPKPIFHQVTRLIPNKRQPKYKVFG